jgi:hypothetical protein
MVLLLAVSLSALPAPFESLVATDLRGYKVYAQPGALRPLKGCNPEEAACHLVEVDKKGPTLCVGFDPGPSEDPTFLLLPKAACGKPASGVEPLLAVGATALIIPGNGFVYSMGQTNSYFDVRRKFEVRGGKVVEVKQPFLWVGGGLRKVKRTPLMDENEPVSPVVLRSEKRPDAPIVATVPLGGEVEVLLSEAPESRWFLVRTAFGLVGWYQTPSEATLPDTLMLYFAGD